MDAKETESPSKPIQPERPPHAPAPSVSFQARSVPDAKQQAEGKLLLAELYKLVNEIYPKDNPAFFDKRTKIFFALERYNTGGSPINEAVCKEFKAIITKLKAQQAQNVESALRNGGFK